MCPKNNKERSQTQIIPRHRQPFIYPVRIRVVQAWRISRPLKQKNETIDQGGISANTPRSCGRVLYSRFTVLISQRNKGFHFLDSDSNEQSQLDVIQDPKNSHS